MTEKKRCSKCKKNRPIEDYYAHPKTKDQLQSQCRVCIKAAATARNKAARKAKLQVPA